ncbi:DUF397 domain-containing protein [Streptomyces sp. NPDC023723]|uniref:DUF397 domain-containing protein n=1 Tax=Streptomyces sp. NPDC023723 TaxID=3154323 RepID=UPI0033FE86B2
MKIEASATQWRKSSYSGPSGGDCVEVAASLGAVRDSKNPAGPVVTVGAAAWRAFIDGLR